MASILMVAGEGLPFIKTGGLADVIGSLPKALTERGHEVKVVMPLYKKISDKYYNELHFDCEYSVSINYHEVPVRVFSKVVDNVCFFFIQHQGYFERDSLYGYQDDGERFGYFQKAVIEMLNQLNYWPNIIHCHDWHTGMIPCMVKETHDADPRYRAIRFVYTIHNMAYQGNFGPEMLDSCLGLPYYLLDNGNVRFDGGISFMKSGILYADKVTTVSPTYAQEILSPQYGEHLEAVLNMRKYDLWGIVNGIDYDDFNPETDKYIVQQYTAKNFRKEKVKNKKALQQQLGLPVDEKKFMVGIVSRLTDQKGLDLVQGVMDELCSDDMQLVVLGTGDERYENMFRHYDWKYHDRVSAQIYYSEEMSHRIYAGCDAFLMPSLFEPCGLSQLMALRYGTVPIVRETGGLRDTVQPYNEFENTGTGFSFANYNAHEMLGSVRYAKYIYYNKRREWNKIIDRDMAADFSWGTSAAKYQELYDWLIG